MMETTEFLANGKLTQKEKKRKNQKSKLKRSRINRGMLEVQERGPLFQSIRADTEDQCFLVLPFPTLDSLG